VKKADILILGAGCAGTSLAHYLEDFGYAGSVVLLDNRTNFDREQRWCSWAELPKSLQPLVQKSWTKWKVCDENRSITRTSKHFSYQQIYAPQFFKHFHSRWQTKETPIKLNSGEKVESVDDKKSFVEVKTDREIWHANLVFDARNLDSNNLEDLEKSNKVYLHQTFLGWKIKFPRAVFEPETATLMDFPANQTNGVNFIYVLPYSDREALVESTSFSQNSTKFGNHLQAVMEYIGTNFGDDYEILAEESGKLPMTTAKLPTKLSERIYAIGVLGGSVRPSSGYAFSRIQRQTSEIARAIVQAKPIPQKVAPRKYGFFDTVFLQAISRNPNTAKDVFLRMFANVNPDSLIRFLSDESSYSDDLALIIALPKIRFGKAALHSLRLKLTVQDETNKQLQASHGTVFNSVDKPSRRLVARRSDR
jgi:lycopene beta-cyclase